MSDLTKPGSALLAVREQVGSAEAEVERLRQRLVEQKKARAGEDAVELEHRPELAAAYDREIAILEADLMLAEAKQAKLAAEFRADQEHEKYLEQVALTRRSIVISGILSLIAIIVSISALLWKR